MFVISAAVTVEYTAEGFDPCAGIEAYKRRLIFV